MHPGLNLRHEVCWFGDIDFVPPVGRDLWFQFESNLRLVVSSLRWPLVRTSPYHWRAMQFEWWNALPWGCITRCVNLNVSAVVWVLELGFNWLDYRFWFANGRLLRWILIKVVTIPDMCLHSFWDLNVCNFNGLTARDDVVVVFRLHFHNLYRIKLDVDSLRTFFLVTIKVLVLSLFCLQSDLVDTLDFRLLSLCSLFLVLTNPAWRLPGLYRLNLTNARVMRMCVGRFI